MRIVYIDIDTLRADHLGCYGYHRPTSPNIDAVAAAGIRFERCYASDVPCLPSRTALSTGRFGSRTGVVGHGGTAAELRLDGPSRGFSSLVGRSSLPRQFERAGMYTTTVSSFAQRHSAFHWLAGFSEAHAVGKRGLETADDVHAIAADWLTRRGQRDDWFLHVHLWDPHTPYRAPADFGDPFADAPLPTWLTEEVRANHFEGCGPNSAREVVGFSTDYPWGDYPRQPRQCDSMAAVRRMFDGYDSGVRYADRYVGRLLEQLDDLGIADETAVVITADHGETLGELNVYCDHHTADEHVARLPMIVRWPGIASGVAPGLCYQFDVAATLLQLCGGKPHDTWDAAGFVDELRAGTPRGREHLVITQGAWTCQRAVRFDDWLCLHTRHDGYHGFPELMLFDVARDPHEQHDQAESQPAVIERARGLLDAWRAEVIADGVDPLDTVLREGGPAHVRGQLASYLERLRATGREAWAKRLAAAHPTEIRD